MSLRDVGSVKDTTTFTLYHPDTGSDLLNADETPMTVIIHGPYSKRYKKALRDQQQRRMKHVGRKSRSTTLSPEEIEEMTNDLLLTCIEDWQITLEGDEKLPFSRETAVEVFEEFPWVRDQLNAAMGDVGDFLEKPKTH